MSQKRFQLAFCGKRISIFNKDSVFNYVFHHIHANVAKTSRPSAMFDFSGILTGSFSTQVPGLGVDGCGSLFPWRPHTKFLPQIIPLFFEVVFSIAPRCPPWICFFFFFFLFLIGSSLIAFRRLRMKRIFRIRDYPSEIVINIYMMESTHPAKLKIEILPPP